MRRFVAAILAAYMWAAAVPAAAHGLGEWLAVVRVHPEPSVTGPDILLGEIAAVEAADPALVEELARLPVGRAALPGHARELSVGTVRVRLRHAGLPERLIRIDAPSPTFPVRTRSQIVSGAELAAAAEAAVWEQVGRWQQELGGGSLVLACPSADDLSVPAGEVELAVSRVTGTPPGSVLATVTVGVDGTPHKNVVVRCEARWQMEVWVVQQLVRRHQVLEGDVVALEVREFTALPRGLVPATEDPAEWRAVRPLTPGTVLAGGAVERVPLVWQGRPVSIVAQAGGVWVGAPGVALQDGRLGDVVRVENASSGFVVRARVVGPDTVEALVP